MQEKDMGQEFPEIFIHIGMHKTGTTFFQKSVFTNVKGAIYLSKPHLNRLIGLDRKSKYIISNESLSGWAWGADRKMFIKDLSMIFPKAHILISFRRQDDWLRSVYNEYIKWGGYLEIDKFFDLHDDKGVIKRDELYFSELLDSIDECFENEPLVFFYDELRSDPQGLVDKIGRYIGCKIKVKKWEKKNKGLTERQISILKKINAFAKSEFNPEGKLRLYNKYSRKYGMDPVSIVKKLRGFLGQGNVTDQNRKYLDQVLDFYKDDWNKIISYSEGLAKK